MPGEILLGVRKTIRIRKNSSLTLALRAVTFNAMPVTIRKTSNGKVSVRTPNGVKAKSTTPAKAAAQKRLLNAVEHSDWRPTGKKSHFRKAVAKKY